MMSSYRSSADAWTSEKKPVKQNSLEWSKESDSIIYVIMRHDVEIAYNLHNGLSIFSTPFTQ